MVGDESPPLLSSKEVLRKAKQEALGKLHDIKSSNPLDGIYNLQFSNDYNNIIHNTGLKPFFIHYWTKEQMLLYLKFPNILIVDATGSVAKSFVLPNGELCPHIFLFQAVIEVNKKTIPAFQMLSASKNTVAIMTWFLEIQRRGSLKNKNFPLPKDFISDFDKATLGAAARIFCGTQSLRHYLQWCFSIIHGKEDEFPSCLLRLDICHYVNLLCRWKCYPKQHPGVRTMYLRAMGILRKQESFKNFHELIVAIFTIALFHSMEEGSPAYRAKEFLRTKIKGISDNHLEKIINDAIDNQELEEVDMCSDDEEESIEFSHIYDYVNNVYNEILENSKNEKCGINDDINGYRLPAFALQLKKFLPYFPIFTEIMRCLKNSGKVNPTSASIESYFNDFKHRQFKAIGLPLRPDKLIVFHIKEIEKNLKEAATGSLIITEKGQIEAFLKEDITEKKKNKNTKTKVVKNSNRINTNDTKTQKVQTVCANNENVINSNDTEKDFNSENVVELHYEADWRNKNKKVHASETENVINEISEEENVNSSTTDKLLNDSDSEPLIEVINFKKLQTLKRKKTKRNGPRYVDECPEFEPSLKRYTWLPLLPNGTKCGNVKENGIIYVLTNTCAFDSIFEIICMTIVNNKDYAQAVQNINAAVFDCAKIFIENKLKAISFQARARTIRTLNCTEKVVQQYKRNSDKSTYNIIKINCVCNVSELSMELFSDVPSYSVTYKCRTCKKSKEENFIVASLQFQIIKNLGIQSLNDALMLPPNERRKCCNKNMNCDVEYGPHILINVEIGSSNSLRICEIPQQIDVKQNDPYKIVGFVSYSGEYDPGFPGHYIGYCLVGNQWIEYDDLSSSDSADRVNSELIVDPQVLLYVRESTQ